MKPGGQVKNGKEAILRHFRTHGERLYTYQELFNLLGLKATPETYDKEFIRLAQIVSRARTSLYREYHIHSVRNEGYRVVKWQES